MTTPWPANPSARVRTGLPSGTPVPCSPTASDTYFEGRPNLDEVVYRIIPDPSTMFLELKAENWT